MKKNIILLSLLVFASQSIFADTNKSCHFGSKPKKHKKHKKSCDNRYVITEKDFLSHDKVSKTLVISKPGNYCFGETINWNPKQRNQTALVIDASNVHLDLNGFELKQVNTQGRQIGIFVKTGNNTISIANGAVRDFTQLGIVVEGNTSNIFLGNDDTFLKVTGCGYGSTFSFLDNVDGQPLLQGGIRLGETKAMAAQGYYTYLGSIDTANLVNIFAEENSPVGMYLGTSSDVISENCYFCRNTDNGREAGNPNPDATGISQADWNICYGILYSANIGFDDVGSNTIQFLQCHFDENNLTAGPSQLCAGMLMGYDINNLLVRESTFNANTAHGGTDGFGIFGCILGGGMGTLIEASEANNNFSEFKVQGYHQSGRNAILNTITIPEGITYRNCNANNNITNGSVDLPLATGFSTTYCNGLILENCNALNNLALSTDPNAFGAVRGLTVIGSNPLTETMNVLISSCHFAGNKVNFSGGDVEGILIEDPASRIVIKDCLIQDNTGSGNDFNVGIFLFNFGDGISEVVVENCTIEDQSFGFYSFEDNNSIYQYNTITNVDFGVFLDTSSCDSVNNNYVANAGFGFVDTSNPSTNLFANNRVFGAATPYDVTYAFGPVPVVDGSLATGFPTGAEVLDNVFMAAPGCTRAMRSLDDDAKAALQEKARESARQARQDHINGL